MGISNTFKVALQTYIDKLQNQIYNYQPSCWASIFGYNKTKLWQAKINAMQHILDYADRSSVSELKNDLNIKPEFRGWDSGLSSNTASKINDAFKSMELNEKFYKHNSRGVINGTRKMANGDILGNNVQDVTLYDTGRYNGGKGINSTL